jgi:hypothetical protein
LDALSADLLFYHIGGGIDTRRSVNGALGIWNPTATKY